jgi:hypothetical protein
VARFTITENGSLMDAAGHALTFASGQAIFH